MSKSTADLTIASAPMMTISARAFCDPGVSVTSRQENDFFRSLRLANGVFKMTADHRLDDINRLLVDALNSLDAKPLEVLDVGAASGITSVELVEALLKAGYDTKLTATDVSLFGSLVRISPNHDVLTDRSGEILQHTILGLPLRPWPRRLDLVTGYWIVRRLANRIARRRLARSGGGEEVMLVSGRARTHPRVSFVEDDMFSRPSAQLSLRFDVVRAANVLNLNYFSNTDLRRAVAAIRQRMRGPGSFLLVARTVADGGNHGTIFRLKEGGGFDVLSRLGRGSEIEDLVLSA